jgi:hypothetical protein
VGSIDEEAPVWKLLIGSGAIECVNWAFPEYRYCNPPSDTVLLDHQKELLLGARNALLTANRDRLERFLLTEADINAITNPPMGCP